MNKTIIILILFSSIIIGQNFEFVGTPKCKMCHNKADKGAQFTIWESSAHAKAFETLKTDLAKNIALEKGISTDPWKTEECVKCHTTGFGIGGYEIMEEAFWSPSPDDKDAAKAVKTMLGLQSVGCESCHGAGSQYKSSKTMKSIYAGEIDGTTVGLMEPNEETCIVCHNQDSPTFEPFNYNERVGIIAHPIP